MSILYAKLLPTKKNKGGILVMALKAVKKTSNAKVTPIFSAEDIGKMGKEYADISAQIKVLEEKKKALADKIKNGVEQFGVKDDKGSFYLEDDSFILGKIAKKSIKIDQDSAVKTLESMGLGDVVDTVTVKSVNEDKLQKALSEKRISFEVVKEFTNESVSYSVSVKEKEALAEVEQSTLKVARKK